MSPSNNDSRASGSITAAIAVGAFLVASLAVVVAAKDGGSSAVDAVSNQGFESAAVALSEFKINPAELTARAGQMSIEVSNDGTMAHNLEVVELAKKTLDLQAGTGATLDLGDVAAGTYTLICNIPGHADSGMKGTLVVSGEGTGDATSTDQSGHGSNTNSGSSSAVQEEFDNAQMEKDMTAGVTKFLEFADKYAAGDVKTGNQPLEPEVLGDGTKRFKLTAAITDWEVSPGKVVKAWTYNGMVPGPHIRVEPGDKVEVVVKNNLPISTDVHLHGVDVPFDQDGVAPITQDYIRPGETYTYKFTAPSDVHKMGMYHAHMHGQVAIINGLFAIFQVGDVPLPTGRTVAGIAVPENLKSDDIQNVQMVLNDAGVIGLSLNGKAFPETQPFAAKKGDWVLLNFFNEGLLGHPMHLHRQPQLVVAKDGYALEAPFRTDTLWISPGERYSVLVKAEDVGTWAFHCHIVSHAENDKGLYGMVTAMVVTE